LNLDPELNHGKVMESAKQLSYRLLPRHLWLLLIYELRTALIRLESMNMPESYRGQTELLVNVGAGKNGRTGWINIDVLRVPGINCVFDCRKRLPFPDGSARAIFCEHFLEHLDYAEDLPRFLSECRRVLRKRGVLRIVVPDGEAYLRGYCRTGWEDFVHLRLLSRDKRDPYFGCRYETKMEVINMVFRQGGEHKYCYDYDTLSYLLRRYGFVGVYKQKFGKSLMPELCIDASGRASESLYVEAVK